MRFRGWSEEEWDLHEDFQASDADHRDPASTSSASITSIVVRRFERRTIAFIASG